jgi:ribosomal protein S18 acetylase RimI-like enzyme
VALIGRHTLFEASSDQALFALADEARRHTDIRMVFGEADRLPDFWYRFSTGARSRTDSRSEFLFERRSVAGMIDPDLTVGLAGAAHLERVAEAHARMVQDETGIDPLAEDPQGFRERCRFRIESGKTWIALSADGELLFKTEVVSRTSKAVYIEGVWLNPKYRGRNIAKKCLENLCHELLDGTNAVCGFVDGSDHRALSLYRRAGFEMAQRYRKIYV